MPRITISYRRDDSLDITGRIFDRLAGHFGREAVFRDIDSIPPGADFRRHIDRVLDESDIILAIVGPRWIGPDNEQLRLASPADPALRNDKPLIPVLVSRAVMPHPDVLPDSLHDFVYRNAVQVDSGQDFDVHVGRLIRAIERLVQSDQERTADEAVQAAPPIVPTPRAERPAEAARQAEEEKQRAEAARQAEEEKQRAETARQAEEEKQRAEAARQAEEEKWRGETTPMAEPPVASVAPPLGRPVRANGGHTVRWVLALVIILGIIGASGWWVLVEQPAAPRPDLADIAAGIYDGDVISDARGPGQSNVRLTVMKTAPNTVYVTSNYARLPPFSARLTRAMNTIQKVGGPGVFLLDLAKRPAGLDVTVDDASWSGRKSN